MDRDELRTSVISLLNGEEPGELDMQLETLEETACEVVKELIVSSLMTNNPRNRIMLHYKPNAGTNGYVLRPIAVAWLAVRLKAAEAQAEINAKNHLKAAKMQAASAQKNETTAKKAMLIAGAIMIATFVQVGLAFYDTLAEKSPVYTISLQEAVSAPPTASQ